MCVRVYVRLKKRGLSYSYSKWSLRSKQGQCEGARFRSDDAQVDESANTVEDNRHVGVVEQVEVRQVLKEVANIVRDEGHGLDRSPRPAVDAFQLQRDA